MDQGAWQAGELRMRGRWEGPIIKVGLVQGQVQHEASFGALASESHRVCGNVANRSHGHYPFAQAGSSVQ